MCELFAVSAFLKTRICSATNSIALSNPEPATHANLHVILQRLSIGIGMLSQKDDILPFSHTLLSMFGGWVPSLDKDSEFTRNRHQRDVT
jgi:hypothetical protein